jgi:hypothetical protein
MNSPADLVHIRSRKADGWELREAGSADLGPAVLLLLGGLCSAAFYDDVLAYAALDEFPPRGVTCWPRRFGATGGRSAVGWFVATSSTSTEARRWCAASATPASPRGSSSAIARRSA